MWEDARTNSANKGAKRAFGPTPGGDVLVEDDTAWGSRIVIPAPEPVWPRVAAALARPVPMPELAGAGGGSTVTPSCIAVSTPSTPVQSVATGTWTKVDLRTTGFNQQDAADLFTLSADDTITVNRAVVTIEADATLNGTTAGRQAGIQVNGVRGISVAGRSAIRTLKLAAGDDVAALVFHSAGSAQTQTGTTWALVLHAIEVT